VSGDLPLVFTVTAVPKPQGSKRAFVVKAKGDGKARAVVVDSDKEPLRAFREAVRATAVEQGAEQLTGPVRVVLAFALPKPKSAERGPRRWPIGKNAGDVDKLTRAVLDALTDAHVWGDDGQVVELKVRKDYPGTREAGYQTAPGVRVLVEPARTADRDLSDEPGTQTALELTEGTTPHGH
jgi:Holliday junction resolvase RusA-like endonuclease